MKIRFLYQTFLGDINAYMTCRPDIGYAVTILSKISSTPSEYYYGLLKQVGIYLRDTTH